jgi:hypothetical protein
MSRIITTGSRISSSVFGAGGAIMSGVCMFMGWASLFASQDGLLRA